LTARPNDPEAAWAELLAGHARFLAGSADGVASSRTVVQQEGGALAPIAAVVACSDARVAPEIVFDQPVGRIFVARVPGNVAAESVRWALDIAVENLGIELVVVMGHTQCLAIKQVVDGTAPEVGGLLRRQLDASVAEARRVGGDVWLTSIRANVGSTVAELLAASEILCAASEAGRLRFAQAVYHVEDGRLAVLSAP
jgi:carbonic anhydrase